MKKFLVVLSLGVFALGAMAAGPEAGKVYRVINNESGQALSDRGPSNVVGASVINEESMAQRWLIGEGSNGLTFRSLSTGLYLRSSNARSAGWTMTASSSTAACQMTVTEDDGTYYMFANGSGVAFSMHQDGSGNIVCWDADNTNSRWNFVEISMTDAEIEAALASSGSMLDELENISAYQAALDAMFVNKQCTQLKSSYQGMTDAQIQADSNYKALPATLQQMVLKVKNDNWAEGTGELAWNSKYAKRFRIQDYKPFSEGGNGAALAGIQAYTNMHNPTGILGNTGGSLYVMVENVPEDENVTLYIDAVMGGAMNNNTTNGTELHEGLNIIPQWSDLAHQFVYYTVATTKVENGKRVPNVKVTDYEPIEIHIEGGELNGYYDYAAGDTKEDFTYMAARAKHEMFDLVGEYVIIHFHLDDAYDGQDNSRKQPGMRRLLSDEFNAGVQGDYVRETMRVWDELNFRERTFMGIQSDEELLRKMDLLWNFYEPLTGDDVADPGFQYSDYFNNRMLAISMPGALYMNATSWRTAYNINTMGPILNAIRTDAGSNWGPAHEIGHCNQGPMKIAGTTEMSNNVFSNVVAYYFGTHTSRADFPRSQLDVFNRDATFLENSTWGCTRMYFQLWVYYHALGHNKKFYPRLYELLRRYPISHPYYLNPRYDMLHFAKMCCVAAQEDLTDFFEAWGFFVPLKDYKIDDYSSFIANLTEEDIQAVKNEIKAYNFPVNKQIIFMDDRPGSKRESWWGWEKENCGPLGGIEDFSNNVQPTGNLSFTLDSSNMVINHEDATGGVGFIIYHNDGTLLGFSNDYQFPIKKTAMAALMSGEAKVYAVGADGTMVEVANDFVNAPIEDHIANLQALLTGVADVYDRIDEEGTRAGWYMPFYAKDFIAAYEAAKTVDAETATQAKVTELYLNLINEYNELKAHEYATIRFVPKSKYQIISAQFPNRALAAGSTKVTNVAAQKTVKDSQTWELITFSGAADNEFKIKNVGKGCYIAKPLEVKEDNYNQLRVTDKASEAGIYTFEEISRGQWGLIAEGGWYFSPNVAGGVATGAICLWNAGTIGSQWILRLVEADEKQGSIANLQQLLAEAKGLLAEAGSISIQGTRVNLTEDMLFSNAKCKSDQYGDQFTSFSVLIDDDVQTYFHSDYSGANTSDKLDHYIGIDLGEGKSLNSIQMTWTNRDVTGSNASVTNPETVRIQGSNDNSKYTTLATLSGLPSGSGASYSSPVISDGNDYRYFRMMVTEGAGDAGYSHEYFAISEIGLNDAVEVVTPDAKYPNVTVDMMLAVRDEIADTDALFAAASQTQTKINTCYEELLAVYNALAEAMGVETSIEEIVFEDADVRPEVQGIYDLQGRKLDKIGKSGIYIVNGKKVLVK